MNDEKKREWLTTGEVADMCEVAKSTVNNWVRTGVLAYRQLNGPGGKIQIHTDTVRDFLREATKEKKGE